MVCYTELSGDTLRENCLKPSRHTHKIIARWLDEPSVYHRVSCAHFNQSDIEQRRAAPNGASWSYDGFARSHLKTNLILKTLLHWDINNDAGNTSVEGNWELEPLRTSFNQFQFHFISSFHHCNHMPPRLSSPFINAGVFFWTVAHSKTKTSNSCFHAAVVLQRGVVAEMKKWCKAWLNFKERWQHCLVF